MTPPKRSLLLLIGLALLAFLPSVDAVTFGADDGLGTQSDQATGELRLLVIAVRFPDVTPSFSLDHLRKRTVENLDRYVREQSFGRAWLKADFRGWVDLPEALSKYKVSPYNFKVDRTRVRKLIEDTMTGVDRDLNFRRYQHLLIIPGVRTTPAGPPSGKMPVMNGSSPIVSR